MGQHLIKSDLAIRTIKHGDPRRRLSDGAGLYLRLFVKGGSHGWRFDYSLAGRRNTLSLGAYPATSLARARQKAAEARDLVASGRDPSDVRRQARADIATKRDSEARSRAGLPALDSFEFVALEWFAKNEPGWAPSHASKILARLERDVFPWLGRETIDSIEPRQLLDVLKRVEDRGAIETAHRIQQIASQVFRYAVATSRATSDPSRDLRGALAPWKPQHYPTLTDPRAVGALLRDIGGYQGHYLTQCALRLSPLLFVRPGELRRAEWLEIDLEVGEWRIRAQKMKARVMHIVPLAHQARQILASIKPLTGSGRWVFPGVRSNGEPMSENTVNAALRRLGYERHALTAHGFRGMASTMLHECGWPTDVIERQLSHVERNTVKAAYNHAEHLPARRKLMQAWADYLDGLKAGGDIVALRAA